MSVDAVALRVAIDGVHESMKVLRDLEQKLKDMGPAARKGSSDAQKAMAQLKTSVQDVQRAYSSAAGRIQSTWGGVTSALRGSAVAAASVAAGFAGVLKVVQMFDKAQGFERVLKMNLGDVPGAQVARGTTDFALRQGVDINSARSGVAALAGTGMTEDLVQTLEAFTALAAKSGATTDGLARAFYQYTQIASQGRLQGDELRAIQENGVQLNRLLREAGLGGRIGSQSNPLTFKEINDALLNFGKSEQGQQALKGQRDQATSSWQSALNEFQVVFLEPLGQQLAPAVKDTAKYLSELAKSIDPKAVAGFVKSLVDGAIDIAKWVAENKDALLTLGKILLAIKGAQLVGGLAKDLMGGITAGKAAIQGIAGLLGKGGAGAAASGAAGLAGSGTVAAIASTVGTVLAGAAVAAAAYTLTSAVLDKMGYKEWLEDKFGANDPMDIAADPATAAKWKNRKRESAEDFARRAQDEWYAKNNPGGNPRPTHDAMGRKIGNGITRAEQNATFAHMMGRSLR